jgi:hypothetical protein
MKVQPAPAQARRLGHQIIEIAGVTIIFGEIVQGRGFVARSSPFSLFAFSPSPVFRAKVWAFLEL